MPPFSLSKIFPYKGSMYLIKYVRPQRSTGARIGLLQNRDLDRDIGRFSTRRVVYKGIGSSEVQNRPFRRFPVNRTSLWEFFGPCTLEQQIPGLRGGQCKRVQEAARTSGPLRPPYTNAQWAECRVQRYRQKRATPALVTKGRMTVEIGINQRYYR